MFAYKTGGAIKAMTNGVFLEEMLQIPFLYFLDIFLTEHLIKLITIDSLEQNIWEKETERNRNIYNYRWQSILWMFEKKKPELKKQKNKENFAFNQFCKS